jgi:hypothetical protein
MASLKVSQKSLTKYSTLYRWNGHFGHLSKVIKNHKYKFWTFWTVAVIGFGLLSTMSFTKKRENGSCLSPLLGCEYG